MKETTTLTSFTDLAGYFPGCRVPDNEQTELERFMSKSPVGKLQMVYSRRRDNPTGITAQMRASAIKEALKLESEDKAKLQIRAYAIVPLVEGSIPFSEYMNYQVYILFPYFNGLRYLPTTRVSLAEQYGDIVFDRLAPGILGKVDKVVMDRAELLPETEVELYNRLIQEVKLTDSLIKEEKRTVDLLTHWERIPRITAAAVNTVARTTRMFTLNRAKTAAVHLYLKAGQRIMNDNFSLGPLYELTSRDSTDSLHRTLEMWNVNTGSLVARLNGGEDCLNVSRSNFIASTNINLEALSRNRQRHIEGSTAPEDYDSSEVIRLLNLA